MAYDYQMGGGYIEGETPEEYQARMEEERKKREAANTPVKQTIITNPDGSQEMTIKGTPEALSPANPNTPTVTQPAVPNPDEYAAETERLKRQAQIAQGTPVGAVPAVPNIGQLPAAGAGVQVASLNPDAGFQRMLQAESGNRDYTPQGTPMTSPKGAMFAAQVMPATAQNPGYGVRPATAQTPEEYNRVGAEYYQAMLKKYNGNENMARAAYNAGPGRVDQAIAQGQAQGVDPISLLPRETQDYIKKTAAPVAPGAGVQVASNEPGAGLAEAARIRENNYKVAYEQGQDLGSFDNRFTAASKDPRKLLDLHNDQNLTPEQRTLAGKQAQTLLNQQMGETRGKEELAGMSEMEIARMLKSKTEEGSFAKLLLLGFVSPTLALKEANKLGLNDQWEKTTVGGEPILFKTRDGVPIEGYNGTTGSKLGGKELIAAAAQSAAGKVTTGAEFFQDKAGNVYQSQRDEKGGTRFVNTQTNKMYSGSEPLQRLRDVAAVDTKRQTTMIQMAKEIATMDYGAKLKAVAEFRQKEINAGRPDLTAEEMSTLIGAPPSPQATVGTKPGAAPAAAPAAAGTVNPQAQQAAVERMQQAAGSQNAGAVVPGAPPAPAPSGVLQGRESVDAANRREAEEKAAREVSTKGREKIVTESSQIVGEASKLFDKIDVVDNAIKKTQEGNNMGQILQGTIPGERQVGRFLGTKDARNTDQILEGVKLISAEGMKVLGANPTDADRDYLTANIPNESWSAESAREWLESRRKFLERKYDIAKKQVSSGGTYVPEIPPAPGGNAGTTSSGNKFKRVN